MFASIFTKKFFDLNIIFKGDGTEEVIACSWDGHTYLVNLKKDAARFQFEENVAAFCPGKSHIYINILTNVVNSLGMT